MYKENLSSGDFKINIGLLGFGYIGSEVFRLMTHQHDYILKKIGKDLCVKIIAEKDLSRIKDIKKERSDIIFTQDARDVINSDVDIVVELIGGVENSI